MVLGSGTMDGASELLMQPYAGWSSSWTSLRHTQCLFLCVASAVRGQAHHAALENGRDIPGPGRREQWAGGAGAEGFSTGAIGLFSWSTASVKSASQTGNPAHRTSRKPLTAHFSCQCCIHMPPTMFERQRSMRWPFYDHVSATT